MNFQKHNISNQAKTKNTVVIPNLPEISEELAKYIKNLVQEERTGKTLRHTAHEASRMNEQKTRRRDRESTSNQNHGM
jgi:hypothetical protein